jgi:diaminohydroxyphosphoribosylaminopyrimidine deaminase/5-amino-6-(5-phosphoribosylamino)uracil reductase
MQHAIELAMRGRGRAEPNPMVGCVLVRQGRIIGEGFHRQSGGPHAEREALAACTEPTADATAYVTLEPCCHTNKQTPPCVPALVEAKIARVVLGCIDPNPAVAGKGIAQLRQAGVAVETGMLEPQCRQLLAAFYAQMVLSRPYVTLKWAESADGKVAGPGGARLQISNATSMKLVHELRSRCDAILVGIGTVLADDPLLTARVDDPPRRLMRIVLDSRLRIPLEAKLVRTARETPTAVYCASGADAAKVRALHERGVEVVEVDARERVAITEVLRDLHRRRVSHVLVEGGPTVARRFIEENLVDRVWRFAAQARVDSPTAPDAPRLEGVVTGELDVAGDRLVEMLNPRGEAFFSAEASADFVLARESVGR